MDTHTIITLMRLGFAAMTLLLWFQIIRIVVAAFIESRRS